LDRERAARGLDVARLNSLLQGGPELAPLQPPAGADPLLTEATQHLLTSQWHERTAKLAALDGQIERQAADLKAAEADVDRLKSILPLLQDRSDRLSGLAHKGFTSRIHASEVEQQLVEAQKNLVGAIDKQHEAEAGLVSAKQQRVQTEREGESNWRKDRADAADKMAAAAQEILKAKKRRELQRLVSPIDGTITNLAAWTVGGVVKPGDTLMNVVPLSVTPEIEAQVLNKDIGFVLPDQRVTVKFDAFPFTRYGTVSGAVVDVSRDSNKDDKLGLIYPVRVRLDAANIDIDGKRVAIAPGMAVSAEIITGDRRLLEYVLSPVLRYRSEAGRER